MFRSDARIRMPFLCFILIVLFHLIDEKAGQVCDNVGFVDATSA